MFWKAMTLAALIAVAGSAPAAEPAAPPMSEREAKDLARALDGKTPGTPTSCVSRVLGTDGLRAVSDRVLIYRVNRDLVYRNDLQGSCTGISRGNTLVLQPTNDQYCRGDIAYAVDLSIGMRGASCALGTFVPYRTAGK